MRNVFVETENVKSFIDTARALEGKNAGVPGMALAYGLRGLGKSRTALYYTAHYNSVYVRSKSVWSPSWLLEELAVELGLVPSKRKKDLFTSVESSLKEQPRLIVIDEANIAPMPCIECIRDLHDLSEAPVILIGHEGIVRRLKRLGPFFDRFLYFTEFKPITRFDLQRFCDSCMDVPVDQEVIAEVVKSNSGNFRKSIVTLKGLEDKARYNRDKSITLKHLNGRQ